LQKLNLVPTYYTRDGLKYHDTASLQSAHAKRATTLSIKQSKYNLLRECSEGFSALIVLITSDESLVVDPLSETDEERQKRAKRVWDKVTSLIGYFNLSPPRVLDLILEVAGAQVTYHWRFFLDLLRCSSWGSTARDRTSGKGKAKSSGDWMQDELESIREAMAGGGDRTLALVLGVKFSFSQVGSVPPNMGIS
jgi:THO complex subunit 2